MRVMKLSFNMFSLARKRTKQLEVENVKKIIAILLVLTMVLGLAACSKPATSSSAATSSAATSSAATSSAATSSASTSKYDEGDTIHIGWIAPLTGNGGATGKFVQEGVELWLKDHDSTIMGKKVEVHIEDTQTSDQGAANAYLKLASRGDISVMGGGQYSSQGHAAMPYVLQYKIPTIHHGSSVKFAALVKEGNTYSWQNRINDVGTGSSIADAAVNVLKMEKICVINDTDSFGQGLADSTVARMKEFGVEPTLVLTFATGEANFDGYMAKIKDAGCDGIVMLAHPNEAALIQIASKDMDIKKLGSPDAGSSTTLQLSTKDAIGWYSISDFVPSIQDEPGKTFVADYLAAYKQQPDMNSSSAYDILSIMKAAIELAGSADPEAINEALPKVKVQGVASTYVFNEDHLGATTQFLAINEEKDGAIVPVIQDTITRADYKG